MKLEGLPHTMAEPEADASLRGQLYPYYAPNQLINRCQFLCLPKGLGHLDFEFAACACCSIFCGPLHMQVFCAGRKVESLHIDMPIKAGNRDEPSGCKCRF